MRPMYFFFVKCKIYEETSADLIINVKMFVSIMLSSYVLRVYFLFTGL